MLKEGYINFVNSWWRSIDQMLLISIVALLSFSVILVTTTGPSIATKIGLPASYFIKKHLIFVALSILIVILLSFMEKKQIIIFGLLFFTFNIFLLILTKFYGYEVKGARRWISILGFSCQPSELLKPALAIVNAWLLTLKDESFTPAISVSILLYIIVATLIIMQPDLGMLVTITAIWAIQLFISGIPFILIFIALILGISFITSSYYLLPHVAQRINGFLDPNQHENYQVGKSLLAFRNGGIYGRGPGEGVVKQVLPDSHTDFIFAVAGEEFGALICSILILLFAFIVIRGLIKILNRKETFSIYAGIGLLFQIASQSIINIGVNLNLLPTKGMTLPFISSGGSSMISIAICFGFIMALTKHKTNLVRFRNNTLEFGDLYEQ